MRKAAAFKTTNKVIPVLNLAKNDDDLRTGVFELLQKANIRTDRGFVLTPLLGGFSSAQIFEINNSYSKYVLKLFTYTEDMCAAKTFYTLAQKNKIPVPSVYYASGPTDHIPMAHLLMERMPGIQMSKLPEAERQAAAKHVGVLLRRIHQIKTQKFGYLNNSGGWQTKDNTWLCKEWLKKINEVSHPEISRILPEVLDKTLLNKRLQDFSKPRLLHGDICPKNVFVKKVFGGKTRITALIDPAEFISGDPMSDLSYTQISCFAKRYRQNTLDGYTMEGTLTEDEHDRLCRWRLIRQFKATCNSIRFKRGDTQDLMSNLLTFLRVV